MRPWLYGCKNLQVSVQTVRMELSAVMGASTCTVSHVGPIFATSVEKRSFFHFMARTIAGSEKLTKFSSLYLIKTQRYYMHLIRSIGCFGFAIQQLIFASAPTSMKGHEVIITPQYDEG